MANPEVPADAFFPTPLPRESKLFESQAIWRCELVLGSGPDVNPNSRQFASGSAGAGCSMGPIGWPVTRSIIQTSMSCSIR